MLPQEHIDSIHSQIKSDTEYTERNSVKKMQDRRPEKRRENVAPSAKSGRPKWDTISPYIGGGRGEPRENWSYLSG